MRRTIAILLSLGAASPALAAEEAFFSLRNTEFIVWMAFLLFIAVIIYLKVPGLLGGMLDKRASGIRDELDEARALRDEAQSLLASFDRKQAEVKDQAAAIVAAAKVDAETAAEQARAELEKSIVRRLASADDQIKSAQDAVIRDVRDQAIAIATAAAADVIARQMTAAEGNKLIESAIAEVDAKLH